MAAYACCAGFIEPVEPVRFLGQITLCSGLLLAISKVAASIFTSIYGTTAASLILVSTASAAIFFGFGTLFLITTIAICALGRPTP